jgi:hypothetical protein
MPTLLQGTYFVVQHHVASSFVQVIRTEEPFMRSDLAARAFKACEKVLENLDRSMAGILLDFRRAPLSTDPELHRVLVMHGDALIMPFARGAVLVSTYVGVMQTNRINRTYSKGVPEIFQDESSALQFVAGHV